MTITDIHEKIYERLIEWIERNKDLRFRPRKTNRGNKLGDGFWFLGNDYYLAIGFWHGVNWKTKVPNIAFMVNSEGDAWLDVNPSDSEDKQKFVESRLVQKLNLEQSGRSYFKKYENLNYLEALDKFLLEDWEFINYTIKVIINEGFEEDLGLGLIDILEFREDLLKIDHYRDEKRDFEKRLKKTIPYKIKKFEIYNFGPIRYCQMDVIPENTQWIFITGENGAGKSSILRALATTIGHRRMGNLEADENFGFKVNLDLYCKNSDSFFIARRDNQDTRRIKPFTVGFAAYGPMRLQPIHGNMTEPQLKAAKGKTKMFDSLFNFNGYLLDLFSEFKIWQKNDKIDLKRRRIVLEEFLEEAMLNVGKVNLNFEQDNLNVALFHEKDSEGYLHGAVTIDKLASGYLSIVSMMGDMLIRLFQQQPKVNDLGDLEGVVMIDEIDIHLHPKLQKHFIEQLSEAFPKIQFVVTTHSPIPMLGAPENSVFIKVNRNAEKGVYLQRLKKLEKEIKTLLPNTILTSDIFDFDFLEQLEEREFENLKLEDNYNEIERNKEIDERIEQLDKDILPDNLFKNNN